MFAITTSEKGMHQSGNCAHLIWSAVATIEKRAQNSGDHMKIRLWRSQQNKREVVGESTVRPGTSCRKKRWKTSIAIADKTILAFDIRVKEPRHHDTVMSRSRRDTISARTGEKTSLRFFPDLFQRPEPFSLSLSLFVILDKVFLPFYTLYISFVAQYEFG